MSRRSLFWVAAVAAWVTGCAVDEPEREWTTYLGHNQCHDIPCGNTPRLGPTPISELAEPTLGSSDPPPYSSTGVRIKSFTTSGGVSLTLQVDGLFLKGIRKGVGWPKVYSKAALVGAKLVAETKTGRSYEMTIEKYGTADYMELGGDHPNTIDTYLLSARDITNPPPAGTTPPLDFVCPAGTFGDSATEIQKYAIFEQGDRYDLATGAVSVTGPDAAPWFNIECNDDAKWKATIFSYAEPAASQAFPSDLVTRTAALRAIRADYCGDGVGWTQRGTMVDWLNSPGWLNLSSYANVEAIWDETGALCLTKPRLFDLEEISCPNGKVLTECTPEQLAAWAAEGELITYVP